MLEAKPVSCVYSSYIHTTENYFTFNLVGIIQEKCVVRQDENHRYFVECSVPGEKGKKRGKGPNSPGDNKKRPNSQVSKTYITVFFFFRRFYIPYISKIQKRRGYGEIKLNELVAINSQYKSKRNEAIFRLKKNYVPTWPSLVTVVLLSVNDLLSWVNEARYVDQTKHDVFFLILLFSFVFFLFW